MTSTREEFLKIEAEFETEFENQAREDRANKYETELKKIANDIQLAETEVTHLKSNLKELADEERKNPTADKTSLANQRKHLQNILATRESKITELKNQSERILAGLSTYEPPKLV